MADDMCDLNCLLGGPDVARELEMTISNVSNLFKHGLLIPSKKISGNWVTTRGAVERYKLNRVENRGNKNIGNMYGFGRKPKVVYEEVSE